MSQNKKNNLIDIIDKSSRDITFYDGVYPTWRQ